MATFIVNELLCFVTNQFDTLNRQNLNSAILEFYTCDELITAKQILVSLCENNGLSSQISELKRNRIGKNVNQKVAKDILDIWDVADKEKGGFLNSNFVEFCYTVC